MLNVQGLQKSISELSGKIYAQSVAKRHFKVDPVLKIDETIYKQTESMCTLLLIDRKALLKHKKKIFSFYHLIN